MRRRGGTGRSRRRRRGRGARAAAGFAAALCAACAPQERAEPRVEFVNSEVTAGLDLPFTDVVRVGDLLFLSGVVGIRPGTLELVPGGLEAEARQALENLRAMLAAAGARPEDVVKCTVMLEEIADWPRFNAVYTEFFGAHRPARSAFGADGLALGAAVEIDCVAAAPPADSR